MGPVISGCMYPFKMLLDSTIWKDVLSIPCCPFPPSPFLCWYLPALSTPPVDPVVFTRLYHGHLFLILKSSRPRPPGVLILR